MRTHVEKRFDGYLKHKLGKKPDILRFVLNHERKHVCIDNICNQIQIMERKPNMMANTKRVAYIIDNMADFFAKVAIEQRIQYMKSDIEKKQITAQADRIKEAEGMVKELEDDVNRPVRVFT